MRNIQLSQKEESVIQEALYYFLEEAKQNLKDDFVLMYDGSKRPIGKIERGILKKREEIVLPILKKFEQL